MADYPVNSWTLGHFLTSFSFGFVGMPAKFAIPFIIGWEIIEQGVLVPLKICWPAEALLDSLIDIIIGLIGYYAGLMVNKVVKRKRWYRRYIDVF